MESSTLEFQYNARTVYTVVKQLFGRQSELSSVDCNDGLFYVVAQRGAWISPFK